MRLELAKQGLALGQVKQRAERIHGLGDALFGRLQRLAGLDIVLVQQQIPRVARVVAHAGGDLHDGLDLRPVLVDDGGGLVAQGRQVAQPV